MNEKLIIRVASKLRVWSCLPSLKYSFSQNPKFKIVDDPKEANKLVFGANGKCRIFEHKNGEREMKWIMRVGTFFTVLNSFLTGMEMAYPSFIVI